MKKVAIVTGASGGIGGAIAKRLAKDALSARIPGHSPGGTRESDPGCFM
jgi:NAD(P)-dependent dehydrogenase (short-subunit alcohol dehydrogenase family)